MTFPEENKKVLVKWSYENEFSYETGYYYQGNWYLDSDDGEPCLLGIVSWIYFDDIQFPVGLAIRDYE
jgi:hypothetical protein